MHAGHSVSIDLVRRRLLPSTVAQRCHSNGCCTVDLVGLLAGPSAAAGQLPVQGGRRGAGGAGHLHVGVLDPVGEQLDANACWV